MLLAAFGKFDFILDIIQLAFGGPIVWTIAGAVLIGLILLYIVGKVLNAREGNGQPGGTNRDQ